MARMLVVCVFAAGMWAPLTAAATPIAGSMGDLRWGLSAQDVERFLVRKVKERADEELRKAKGSKRSAIESRRDQQVRQIEQSLVHFDGGRSRWDSGPVADQFTHGNNEAMLAYDDGKSRNYYFFIGDHLWKWYKSFPASEFGGKDFKRFQKLVAKKYGSGRVKSGEMYPGTGEELKWIEYLDRNTRLRAVDKVNPHGEYGLAFEEMATVRDLATLRTESGGPNRPRMAAKRRAPEPAADEQDERPSREVASSGGTSRAKHKSIDDDSDQHGETRAEYEARKKKVLAEERNKDKAVFERKQDKKQGKTLDTLAGINDDDPLSGMK